jgi:diadenosine tetraphosphate (Ap4A) HIT family hydrolase
MSCLFCSIVDSPIVEHPEDEIIDESENFYAKAALGHFVFGYSLVISKEHLMSFASLPLELFPELDSFSASVASKVAHIAGRPVMLFEHGAIDRPRRAGSCIDHAHLHLFPVGDLLVAPLSSLFEFAYLAEHPGITHFERERTPYLYFKKADGQQYAAPVGQDLPSQFIRRLACDCLGCADLWDWRDNPLRDRLQPFKERYKGLR